MTALTDRSNLLLGVLCGMGAGALWGLVFLAPELTRDFSPLQLTIGRYTAYGVIAAALIAPRWRAVAGRIGRAEWTALAWLSMTGNTLYYILLASAVQLGGIALTSLVIGFLPVAVTLVGSRDRGAVPLRRLAPSILLCVGGALCIGWQAVGGAATSKGLIGLACAVGALISWTVYAVGNARWLRRLDGVSAHEWSLLTGVVTGAQSLLLIPFVLVLDRFGQDGAAWARFAAVCAAVAVLASICGNALWNRMSRLLPLTLVGQMILFETLFALAYGFFWERRWPTALEIAAFGFVTSSVVTCLMAHRPKALADIPAG
jgi:drug/metabolite transporter (DMT)-like permease